ncbi:MAG: filamentous hemagglutinin N-terminal domain-containing protein, partial [Gammaproteobacteria bacterium]
MDLPDYRRIPRLRAILLAGLHLCGPAYGQVTADTTGATGLGSVVNGMSDFEISGGLQPPNSTNLFHSFREFDLTSTQSATFTGPASVQNIISRVTGRDGANNDGSNLDGRLGSDIPGANLWFFNPAGIAFGPNATLDVQGSFHVSTGDSVTLKGAARFDKDMSQQQILELAAKPQAFGFLTEPEGFGFSMDNPEQVSIEGSVLSVSEPGESNTLSIIGGDVAVAGGTPAGAQQRRGAELIADDGRINIASVSSPGDVRLTAEGIETSEGQQLGFIDIRDSSFVDAVSGEQPDEAATGGSLFVRGGKFVLDNSVISVSSIGSDPGEIDIRVDDLTVDNGAVIDANTLGDEGDFTDAHLITIAAANSVTVSNGGKITSDTNGGTDGGITRIEANEISVADTRDPGEITGDEQRSQISSSATASGGGG